MTRRCADSAKRFLLHKAAAKESSTPVVVYATVDWVGGRKQRRMLGPPSDWMLITEKCGVTSTWQRRC